jgi:crotonobetainyl-CoA:carnitine CoA-transferase CaiB-like acyl-CoA transferase
MTQSNNSNMALQGLKVIEMGQLIAGPFASKLLGEFGAEVIKIEPPGVGDPLRKWRKIKDGTSLWWHAQQALADPRPEAGRSAGHRPSPGE